MNPQNLRRPDRPDRLQYHFLLGRRHRHQLLFRGFLILNSLLLDLQYHLELVYQLLQRRRHRRRHKD